MPDLVVNTAGVAQYISYSYWLRIAVDRITEATTGDSWNPWSWFVEQAAGDWEEVSRAGDALTNLAEFNSASASAILGAADATVPYGWDGNAASSAYEYFITVHREVNDHVTSLRELGSQLDQMAAGIFFTIQAIQNLLDRLLDLVIEISLCLAGTIVFAKTGVGPVVFGALTASKIWQAAGLVRQILTMWNDVVTGAYGFTGILATYLAPISGTLEKLELSSSYQHPAKA